MSKVLIPNPFLAAKRSSTSALFSLSVRLSVRPFQNQISHCLVSL